MNEENLDDPEFAKLKAQELGFRINYLKNRIHRQLNTDKNERRKLT